MSSRLYELWTAEAEGVHRALAKLWFKASCKGELSSEDNRALLIGSCIITAALMIATKDNPHYRPGEDHI